MSNLHIDGELYRPVSFDDESPKENCCNNKKCEVWLDYYVALPIIVDGKCPICGNKNKGDNENG